jgi:uncharacterized protein YuzE
MRLSYDPKTDSLYIHLTERPSIESDEVANGIVLDFAEDGALVGIDVQHASRQVDISRLMIDNMPFHALEAA